MTSVKSQHRRWSRAGLGGFEVVLPDSQTVGMRGLCGGTIHISAKSLYLTKLPSSTSLGKDCLTGCHLAPKIAYLVNFSFKILPPLVVTTPLKPTDGLKGPPARPFVGRVNTRLRSHPSEQDCTDYVVMVAVPYSLTNVPKESEMKSTKLFVPVLGALVVLALSLPVMAQSTTQSTTTTTTTQDPQPAVSQTTTPTTQDPQPAVSQTTTTTIQDPPAPAAMAEDTRSEERRVGKERRSRW